MKFKKKYFKSAYYVYIIDTLAFILDIFKWLHHHRGDLTLFCFEYVYRVISIIICLKYYCIMCCNKTMKSYLHMFVFQEMVLCMIL